MRYIDFANEVGKRLHNVLGQMKCEIIPFAEKGKEKLWLKLYEKVEGAKSPLRRVSFLVLEDGWVKNIKAPNIIDECELTAVSFIPAENVPLPIFAFEASIHFGKYAHLNADLFPVSKDKKYREIFCEPVKNLRNRYDKLEGLLPGARKAFLEDYSSGGMMAGDFTEDLWDKTIPWLFDYIELYRKFLEDYESISILKEKEIIEEGKNIAEMFLSTFRKFSPRILTDIPNLYTDELGKKLGEYLF